jgi:transcriptional regulator with PAS, ATPase and Fis domain
VTEVSAGRFRADLYYRMAGVDITLPPLRERREDIPLLAEHFLAQFRERSGERVYLAPEAIVWLQQQEFPGNLRELRQMITRAASQSNGGLMTVMLLEAQGMSAPRATDGVPALQTAQALSPRRERLTASRVKDALARHGGHRGQAAQTLGIAERTLYRWIKRNQSEAA